MNTKRSSALAITGLTMVGLGYLALLFFAGYPPSDRFYYWFALVVVIIGSALGRRMFRNIFLTAAVGGGVAGVATGLESGVIIVSLISGVVALPGVVLFGRHSPDSFAARPKKSR